MIFKVYAGSIYCGVLTVGVYGQTFYTTNGLEIRRRSRVAKIAGYKRLSLKRVY